MKLGKNVADKCIPCPACEIAGKIKENSYITTKEIRKLLTLDEFNSFLLLDFYQAISNKCESEYP